MSGEDYMEVQKMVAELQAEVRRDMFTDKWIEDDVEKMIQQYLTVRKIIQELSIAFGLVFSG